MVQTRHDRARDQHEATVQDAQPQALTRTVTLEAEQDTPDDAPQVGLHDEAILEPVAHGQDPHTEQHLRDSALADAQHQADDVALAAAQEAVDERVAQTINQQLNTFELPPQADDEGMNVPMVPEDDISLEESIVKYPVPIHVPERPWNRPPKGSSHMFVHIRTYSNTPVCRRYGFQDVFKWISSDESR